EIYASPAQSLMRTYREDGGIGGEIRTSPTASLMRTYGDSTVGRSYSQVDPQRATMNVVNSAGNNTARITADGNSVTLFSATNGQRYLKLDDTGIWIETGGKSYNLEETAQDSGWQDVEVLPGYQAQPSQSPQVRRLGNSICFRGGISNLGIGPNAVHRVMKIPAGYRGDRWQYGLGVSSSVDATYALVVEGDGTVQVKTGNKVGAYYLLNSLTYAAN